MIFLSTLVITIFKLLLRYHFDAKISVTEIICYLWTSFIANFGGKPSKTVMDNKHSYKCIILVSLLSGTIFWISYRAKLISELSIIDKRIPFTDLESFSKSNWR